MGDSYADEAPGAPEALARLTAELGRLRPTGGRVDSYSLPLAVWPYPEPFRGSRSGKSWTTARRILLQHQLEQEALLNRGLRALGFGLATCPLPSLDGAD